MTDIDNRTSKKTRFFTYLPRVSTIFYQDATAHHHQIRHINGHTSYVYYPVLEDRDSLNLFTDDYSIVTLCTCWACFNNDCRTQQPFLEIVEAKKHCICRSRLRNLFGSIAKQTLLSPSLQSHVCRKSRVVTTNLAISRFVDHPCIYLFFFHPDRSDLPLMDIKKWTLRKNRWSSRSRRRTKKEIDIERQRIFFLDYFEKQQSTKGTQGIRALH